MSVNRYLSSVFFKSYRIRNIFTGCEYQMEQ